MTSTDGPEASSPGPGQNEDIPFSERHSCAVCNVTMRASEKSCPRCGRAAHYQDYTGPEAGLVTLKAGSAYKLGLYLSLALSGLAIYKMLFIGGDFWLTLLFLILALFLAFVCWAINAQEIAVGRDWFLFNTQVGHYRDVCNHEEAKTFFADGFDKKQRFEFKTRPPGVPAGEEVALGVLKASFSRKRYAAAMQTIMERLAAAPPDLADPPPPPAPTPPPVAARPRRHACVVCKEKLPEQEARCPRCGRPAHIAAYTGPDAGLDVYKAERFAMITFAFGAAVTGFGLFTAITGGQNLAITLLLGVFGLIFVGLVLWLRQYTVHIGDEYLVIDGEVVFYSDILDTEKNWSLSYRGLEQRFFVRAQPPGAPKPIERRIPRLCFPFGYKKVVNSALEKIEAASGSRAPDPAGAGSS